LIKITILGLSKNLLLSKKELSDAINVAGKMIGYKKKETRLNILFTNDKTISKFHQQFLKDPTPTDVITFPMGDINPENGEFILGDLMISKETALREARQRKTPIQKEITLYAIHGFLHLNGFDDHRPKDRKEMNLLQNKILRKLFP
jgi:probable rRNA maturation factor